MLLDQVVVVRHAPQRGFDAAQQYGRAVFEIAPDQVAVGDHRAIGPAVIFTAGGVVIQAPLAAAGIVIGYHGIHTPAGHTPKTSWVLPGA